MSPVGARGRQPPPHTLSLTTHPPTHSVAIGKTRPAPATPAQTRGRPRAAPRARIVPRERPPCAAAVDRPRGRHGAGPFVGARHLHQEAQAGASGELVRFRRAGAGGTCWCAWCDRVGAQDEGGNVERPAVQIEAAPGRRVEAPDRREQNLRPALHLGHRLAQRDREREVHERGAGRSGGGTSGRGERRNEGRPRCRKVGGPNRPPTSLPRSLTSTRSP